MEYTGFEITVVAEDIWGYDEDSRAGVDVEASEEKYLEMARGIMEKAFSGAAIEVATGSPGRTDVHLPTEALEGTDEHEFKSEVEELLGQMWSSFRWVVYEALTDEQMRQAYLAYSVAGDPNWPEASGDPAFDAQCDEDVKSGNEILTEYEIKISTRIRRGTWPANEPRKRNQILVDAGHIAFQEAVRIVTFHHK